MVAPQESKERAPIPKEAPRFEVVNPKSSNDKSKNLLPQYKYATELMNETNQEHIFQKLLDQPVTLKLGELLGTSYDLSRRFQTAMRSQRCRRDNNLPHESFVESDSRARMSYHNHPKSRLHSIT